MTIFFNSENDWRRGVGPVEQRARTLDWHFGYDVGNGFGTAEFVAFCRRIGAEPQINLTTGTGSLREALAWVEYCNGAGDSEWANLRRVHGYEEPFNVRYWQIGNEEWALGSSASWGGRRTPSGAASGRRPSSGSIRA